MDPDLPPGALNFEVVLFLDFDGVLHPEGCGSEMEFCFRDQFCDVVKAVDPRGELPIVISSMWRNDTPIAKMRDLLPDIGRQIVGVTPSEATERAAYAWGGDTSTVGHRQREIQAWLREFVPDARWLAIDDRANYFAADCPHLFLVPGLYEDDGGGIDGRTAVLLKQRLENLLADVAPIQAAASGKPRV